MKRKLLLVFFSFICFSQIVAQQFPVNIIPRVKAPAPVNFYNYADETALDGPITVQIFLNDLTVSSRQIRLKTYFEGGNINFSSNDFVIGAQNLFIEGGIPLTLTNAELAPYYRIENIQGINQAVYAQSIPEGSYNFCFEVYDFLSGAKLSDKKCTPVFIFKNEPPILNVPLNGVNIEPSDFENIVFQWTPRQINVSNVEYDFSIVEVWDNAVDPQTAFLSQAPIYEETVRTTSIIYGPDKPLLLPGKKYAWRVRARALQGLEEVGLFKNEGYSEVFWFSRTTSCQIPEGVTAETKGTSKINIFWDQDPTIHSEYIIAYREANNSDANWFTKRTNSSWATIWDLKPGTAYEYKVKGKCIYQFSEYSELQYVTTDIIQNEDANYNCGIVPDEVAISNRDPHPGLTIGDQITAGDFKVTITEIQSQSNGTISGKGFVPIPYLKFAKFGVTFSNILVNTDNQLAEGEIVTLYDPEFGEGASMTVDVNVNISEGVNGDSGELDENVEVDFIIDSIETDENGAIVVTGTNGETVTIPGDDDVNIISANGDVWSVGEDGTITKQEGAAGGPVSDTNTTGLGADGEVVEITAKGITVKFKNTGFYYFDKLPENTSDDLEKEYKAVATKDGKYFIPYKAISDNYDNNDSNSDDYINAVVDITDENIKKKDVIFKTKEGGKIPVTWDGNIAKLALKRKFHYADEEILAVVKSKDTTKYDIAGSLITTHLASDKLEPINVTIVPVGVKEINDELKEKVTEIYAKAGVRLNIQVAKEVLPEEVYGWDKDGNKSIEVGDSSILSYYTSEEAVFNSYIKQQPYYSNKTYYVFVTNLLVDKPEVKGFMPLKRQFGFVFTRGMQNNLEKQARVMAHELGHGIFGLKHTWDEYKSPQGATDFLMDYGEGTVLNHMDWKKIHAPGIQIYWFQGDEEGENRINDGIDLLGNIITKVEYDVSKVRVVGIINDAYPFLRAGYKVYTADDKKELLGSYQAKVQGNKVNYVNEKGEKLPHKIIITNRGIAKLKKALNNNCSYGLAEIYWKKENFSSVADVVNKIKKEVSSQNPKWTPHAYYKPDVSCQSANTLSDIIKLDASTICADPIKIDEAHNKIVAIFSNPSSTEDQIVQAINGNCLNALRKFSYPEIIDVFRILATSESIKEQKEIAILRLMTVIDSSNYKTFFDLLKENDNKIYKNLLSKIEDATFYWFGKDNLENLIEVLLFMHNKNSETVDVRVDLIKLMIEFKEENPNDYSSMDAFSSKNSEKIFSSNIKQSEKEFFYSSLSKDNFKLFIDFHDTRNKFPFEKELWSKIFSTFVDLLAEKGTAEDLTYLYQNLNLVDPSVTHTSYPDYRDKIFKSYLFTKYPSNKKSFYTHLSNNGFDEFLTYIKSISNLIYNYDPEELIKRTVDGFSKLIDEEGKAVDKIVILKWALDHPDTFSGRKGVLGELLVNILHNISTQEDKDLVYSELSKDKHDLFIKCAEALKGSSDHLFGLAETYSKLISEATTGKVKDRIDIIEYATKGGDDWSWFWFSDTEDVVSAMFSHMSTSQTKDFIQYFKDDNYKLFFKIWDVLKNTTFWGSIDNDNKRFENFVTSFAKNFIIAGQLAQNQFPNDLIQYKDKEQKYLSSKVDDIKEIKGNYVPMTRSNFFDGTGERNDYDLDAEVSGKKIHVKIDIEDLDGKHKLVIDKKFEPFQYVFIELLQKVKINETLSYEKGSIIAIPAFYLAWMDGYISSDQLGTAIRVGVDAVVIVVSAAAAVGTGGASLAVLGAEIFFAATDATIALKGDEMKQIFGDDFVNGLEIANMAWGIANLPAAVTNIPKGLAKLKVSATKTLESGTDAFRTFIKNAPDLKNIKVELNLKKLAAAIKVLNKADRSAYIKRLKDNIASVAIKYENLIASGNSPTQKIKDYYSNARRMLFSILSNGKPLTFNRISDDILNLIGSEINILKKSLNANKSGKYADVVIHNSSPGKYVLRVNNVDEVIDAAELAEKLKDIDPTKTIRMLSCDNSSSAIEISQALGRDVIHSTGEIKIFENGVIEAEKWHVASPDGNINDITVNNVATGSGKHIVLYKNYVDAIGDALKADLLAFFKTTTKYDEFIEMLTNSRVPSNWNIEKVGGVIRFTEEIGNETKVWAELVESGSKFKMKAVGGVGNLGSSGKINHLLNVDPPLMKDFIYEVDNGRFIFETDQLGRVKKITDNNVNYNSSNAGRRNGTAQQRAKKVKDGKNPGDDGGHMASAESGGPVEQINYFPQNPDFNQPPGLWREMEMYLKGLKDGDPSSIFKFEVIPSFSGNSKRPSKFFVKISKNGTPVSIPNEYRVISNPL